jgi:hypothetical protein
MSLTSIIGQQEWSSGMGFREKFGSLFRTDNQKRLQEYTEQDLGLQQRSRDRRFKARAAEIERSKDVAEVDPREARSLEAVGARRDVTSARTVAESFGPAAGIDLRAMAPIRG